MNRGYESSDNFSNMLEYMNSYQHSSSESINELDTTQKESKNISQLDTDELYCELEQEYGCRNNSIMSEDKDYIITSTIPIPPPTPINIENKVYDTTSITKLCHKLSTETSNTIGSLITKYYEEVGFNLSPYSK